MGKRSMNEAPPAPERLRAMEDLLAPREELAGLVQCILDWDFVGGPFMGAHLSFEWSNWGQTAGVFGLSLKRSAVQSGVAWRGVRIVRGFSWSEELPLTVKAGCLSGNHFVEGHSSPHPKDRCIVQASFEDILKALSAVRASIPEEAFTRVKP